MGYYLEQLRQNLHGIKDFPADIYSSIKYGTFRQKLNQARNRMRYGHSESTDTDKRMNQFGNELAKTYAMGMAGIYAPMFIPVGESSLATWGFNNLLMPKVGTNAIKWGTQLASKVPKVGSWIGNPYKFYNYLDLAGNAANTGMYGYWGYQGGKDLYDQATGKKDFSLLDTGMDLLGMGLMPYGVKEMRNLGREIGNEFFFVRKPGMTASEGFLNGTPSRMIYRNGENPMTIVGNKSGEYIPRVGVRLTEKTGNTPVGKQLKSAMFDQEFYGNGPFGVTLKLDNATKKPNIVSGNYWKPKIAPLTLGTTAALGAGHLLEGDNGNEDYYEESEYKKPEWKPVEQYPGTGLGPMSYQR